MGNIVVRNIVQFVSLTQKYAKCLPSSLHTEIEGLLLLIYLMLDDRAMEEGENCLVY